MITFPDPITICVMLFMTHQIKCTDAQPPLNYRGPDKLIEELRSKDPNPHDRFWIVPAKQARDA